MQAASNSVNAEAKNRTTSIPAAHADCSPLSPSCAEAALPTPRDPCTLKRPRRHGNGKDRRPAVVPWLRGHGALASVAWEWRRDATRQSASAEAAVQDSRRFEVNRGIRPRQLVPVKILLLVLIHGFRVVGAQLLKSASKHASDS